MHVWRKRPPEQQKLENRKLERCCSSLKLDLRGRNRAPLLSFPLKENCQSLAGEEWTNDLRRSSTLRLERDRNLLSITRFEDDSSRHHRGGQRHILINPPPILLLTLRRIVCRERRARGKNNQLGT